MLWNSQLVVFKIKISLLQNLEVDDSEQINRRRKLLRRFHDTPPSGQKVRLRGDKNAFSGYLEMWHPQLNQWGYVCDRDWDYQDAAVACRQMGFSRGVHSTSQGFVWGEINQNHKMTEAIECEGDEGKLKDCRVHFTSNVDSRCDHQLTLSLFKKRPVFTRSAASSPKLASDGLP